MVSPREALPSTIEAAEALVEELLRAGFVLSDLIGTLIEDLPEDAFPGEDNARVLLEMVAGSGLPAVEAAGGDVCRAATALIGAIRDRALDDLRAAAAAAVTRTG